MANATMTQQVADLERATKRLPETSPKEAIESLCQFKVEACSHYHGQIVATPYHPFVAAVHAAFKDHRPLVVSPDMF